MKQVLDSWVPLEEDVSLNRGRTIYSTVEDLLDEVAMLRQVELDLGTIMTATAEKYFPVVPDSRDPTWLKILHLPDGWVVEAWETQFRAGKGLRAQVAGDTLVECLCKLGEIEDG